MGTLLSVSSSALCCCILARTCLSCPICATCSAKQAASCCCSVTALSSCSFSTFKSATCCCNSETACEHEPDVYNSYCWRRRVVQQTLCRQCRVSVTCSGMLTDFEHVEARPGRYPVTFSNTVQDKETHPGLLSKESVFQVAEACARVVSAPSSRTKHVACAGLLTGSGTRRLLYLQLHSLPAVFSLVVRQSRCADTLPFTHRSIDFAHDSCCKEHSILLSCCPYKAFVSESGPGASPGRPFAGSHFTNKVNASSNCSKVAKRSQLACKLTATLIISKPKISLDLFAKISLPIGPAQGCYKASFKAAQWRPNRVCTGSPV